MSFDDWIGFIINDEGPEVNRGKSEPGGISKYGVSLEAYGDYCKANSLPPPVADVIANLTVDQAITFYKWFFTPLRLAEMPDAVAYRLADIETSLGPTGGLHALGLASGTWPLPLTVTDTILAKVKAADPKVLCAALSGVWVTSKYDTPEGWASYGHGWTNRYNTVNARIAKMLMSNM